jgi:hypothetical protein
MSRVTCIRVADTVRAGRAETGLRQTTSDERIVGLRDIELSRGVGKVNETNFGVHSIARVGRMRLTENSYVGKKGLAFRLSG